MDINSEVPFTPEQIYTKHFSFDHTRLDIGLIKAIFLSFNYGIDDSIKKTVTQLKTLGSTFNPVFFETPYNAVYWIVKDIIFQKY